MYQHFVWSNLPLHTPSLSYHLHVGPTYHLLPPTFFPNLLLRRVAPRPPHLRAWWPSSSHTTTTTAAPKKAGRGAGGRRVEQRAYLDEEKLEHQQHDRVDHRHQGAIAEESGGGAGGAGRRRGPPGSGDVEEGAELLSAAALRWCSNAYRNSMRLRHSAITASGRSGCGAAGPTGNPPPILVAWWTQARKRELNRAPHMTRVIHDSGDGVHKEALDLVSSDVNFPKGHFPDYRIGPNNQIIDPEETHEAVPLKEIVAKETAQLLEQHKRLSVRDLKEKFEKGLSGATKLSEEAKRREAASLDRQVLLKKLRDVLDTLKGRVAGRNRDDAEEAISLVEALAVQLTQREGELIYEKAEVKKLANFLKQATEDARKVAEEERALALAEIEKARASIEKVEKALQVHDSASSSREKEEIEELKKEVREARRIKMLHQPSKVMDMEFELKALRTLISEKTQLCNQLKKELAMIKRLEEDSSNLFELEGSDTVGSQLRIIPRVDGAPNIANCPIQWYRVIPGGTRDLISGATKLTYAPEPFDVGRLLQAEIVLNADKIIVQTDGAIENAAGLERYVDSLMKRTDIEFNVVITQMNGKDYSSSSVHAFHIGKLRIKLRKGWSTKARETYSTTMKLCGSRGGGNAAARAVFWQARKGLSYTLAFETDRDRNAAIMLARKFALNCNVALTGPGDQGT